MKTTTLIFCLILTAFLAAESADKAKKGKEAPAVKLPENLEEYTIKPAEPTFTWKADEEGVPLERDPLTPIDYVWPRPQKEIDGKPVEPQKPKAEIKLKVQFISYSDRDRFAKVSGFTEFLEEGKSYAFMAGSTKVVFQVTRIEPNKLVIEYEGTTFEFSPETISTTIPGGGQF